MSCSKKGWHSHARGSRRLHVILTCYWKEKVLLSTRVKASKREKCWLAINLVPMIETTKAQLLKYVVNSMVVINMNPMPWRTIGKKAYLWVRSIFGLSKDPRPMRCPNTWKKKEYKENNNSMKVEEKRCAT